MNAGTLEERATAVLQQCGVIDAPVNPIAIALQLGYRVNAVAFPVPTIAGRTLVRDAGVSIDVNIASSAPQRSFTLAHEIGHAVLHLSETENAEIADFYMQIDRPRTRKEVEADEFAVALLMPAAILRKRYEATKVVPDLAKQFGVTTEVMTNRLRALGLSE